MGSIPGTPLAKLQKPFLFFGNRILYFCRNRNHAKEHLLTNSFNRVPSWVLRFIFPVLAGCSIFLGFERYNFSPAILLLPFFLHGMRQLPLRQKLLAYWLMAIVTNLGGFGWIRIVASEFGGIASPLAWSLVLLFSLFNNLNFVLWGYWEKFWGEKQNPFITATFFVAAEQLNPQIFPWYFGATLDSTPLLYQTADLFGAPGLSFVAIALIHLPYWLWRNRRKLLTSLRPQLTAQIFFLSFILIYGAWCLKKYNNEPAAGKKKVAVSLVQSNTEMAKFYGLGKSRSERYQDFQQLMQVSEKAIQASLDSCDLLVLPESAIHFAILQTAAVHDKISQIARKYKVNISAGSIEFVGEKSNGKYEYYNTLFVFDSNGEIVDRYRKIMLLAFGEYIPFVDIFPALEKWLPETISNFSRGRQKPVFKLKENVTWLPLICYEDIIFGFVAGFDHSKADFFVNTTNDGWFGRSAASHLHKQMARARTVEYRKPMIRALNTGTSLIIDSAGRTISKETDLYTQDFLNTTLNIPAKPPVTLFAIIGRLPIILLMGVTILFWAVEFVKRRKQS